MHLDLSRGFARFRGRVAGTLALVLAMAMRVRQQTLPELDGGRGQFLDQERVDDLSNPSMAKEVK